MLDQRLSTKNCIIGLGNYFHITCIARIEYPTMTKVSTRLEAPAGELAPDFPY